MTTISVQAGRVSQSTVTDTEGARDVRVTVRYDGQQYRGEATVVTDPINGGYMVFGDAADMWVSPALMADICAASEGSGDAAEVWAELAGAVVAAAEAQ